MSLGPEALTERRLRDQGPLVIWDRGNGDAYKLSRKLPLLCCNLIRPVVPNYEPKKEDILDGAQEVGDMQWSGGVLSCVFFSISLSLSHKCIIQFFMVDAVVWFGPVLRTLASATDLCFKVLSTEDLPVERARVARARAMARAVLAKAMVAKVSSEKRPQPPQRTHRPHFPNL